MLKQKIVIRMVVTFSIIFFLCQRAHGWEIKNNVLIVKVKQVVDSDLPTMSKDDVKVAFTEAGRILKTKLGVDVKFKTVETVDVSKVLKQDFRYSFPRYFKNGKPYRNWNPLEALEKTEKDFQEELTMRIQIVSTRKDLFNTSLLEIKKASSFSEKQQEEIKTPEQLSVAIFQRFKGFIKKFAQAKIKGKPVFRKDKEKFIWLQSWINTAPGNSIHRKNTYDITLTNEPILDLEPMRLNGSKLSYTCCLSSFSLMIVSSFVIYHGYETGTSLMNIDSEMKPRKMGIFLAYSVSDELLRMYCPFVRKKGKNNQSCMCSSGKTPIYASTKSYNSFLTSPACPWEKEQAQKGFLHLVDLQDEWLKQQKKSQK